MYIRAITALVVSLAAATTTSSVPLLSKRIVNGTPFQKGELPSFSQVFGCGGVLIGPQTVLTAAHCSDHPDAHPDIHLGGLEVEKGTHRKLAKAVTHPEYNDTSSVNDITVVFFQEKIDGPYASVEETSYPEEGSKLTVAGFGYTSAEATTPPDILLKVQATMGNVADCAEHKDTSVRIFDPKSQVCAIDNGHSACHGDSGGPLYSGSGKDVHVVGLVSGAGKMDRCGEKGTYQYYTFIKPFIPWIKSEIEKFEQDGANGPTGSNASKQPVHPLHEGKHDSSPLL